jgi:hypothetical protein
MKFLLLSLELNWTLFVLASSLSLPGNVWLVLLVWIVMCSRVGTTFLLLRFVRKNDYLDGLSVHSSSV